MQLNSIFSISSTFLLEQAEHHLYSLWKIKYLRDLPQVNYSLSLLPPPVATLKAKFLLKAVWLFQLSHWLKLLPADSREYFGFSFSISEFKNLSLVSICSLRHNWQTNTIASDKIKMKYWGSINPPGSSLMTDSSTKLFYKYGSPHRACWSFLAIVLNLGRGLKF